MYIWDVQTKPAFYKKKLMDYFKLVIDRKIDRKIHMVAANILMMQAMT